MWDDYCDMASLRRNNCAGNIMGKHIHLPATFVMDAETTIRSWNAECQWLFGITAQEAIGQPFTCLLEQGHEDSFRAHAAQARTKAVQRPTRLVARDDTHFTANMTVVAQHRGDGNPPDSYIVIIDTDLPPEVEVAKAESDTAIFKRFSEYLPGPFYVLDPVGHLVLWNRLLEQATQLSSRELTGAHALDFFDAKEQATIKQKMRNAFELGRSSVEATVVAKDGTRTPYLFNCARTMLDGMVCICGMGIDITEHRKAEEVLHLHERANHASVNGVVIARHENGSNRIEYANPAFEAISGYSREEVIGRDLLFLCNPDLDPAEHRRVLEAIRHCHSVQSVMRSERKEGELFWNDLKIAPVTNADGTVTHFVGVSNDVTNAKLYEAQLEHLANHDPLTGLANRNLLQDHLSLAILSARRSGMLATLAFIDIDNFKCINDTLGHSAGDRVLKLIATRLRACVRESDTVARVGGDEFVIIFANQPSVAHVVEQLERVRQSVAEPIATDGHELYVNVSIGVSVFPRDGEDAETLLRGADAAMYHAKFIGRNNYQFYSPDLNAAVAARLQLEGSLRNAIERKELFLLYQPKIDIRTGKIVGAEALVRWQHPVRGLVAPAEFIPVAEETGLIVPLGEWVLTTACAELKELQSCGFMDFSIAVNLSGRQFKQRNFVERLADLIRSAGIRPQSLELELTESQLMDNPAYAAHTLSELKKLGVRLSIDDFGTGYSSLSYLQKFPVDSIKIDRTFVKDVSQETEDAIITRAVISLGHNLNVKVIAEGVETQEQLAFLRRYHCDQIQGFYFSEAISAERLHRLLDGSGTMLRA